MNRMALVTGASRGIGRGIALALAECGHDLVINYAGNRAAAEQTAQACTSTAKARGHKIRAEVCQADISEAADRKRLLAFAQEKFERLDLLVNNAGVAPAVRADLLDASEESFDRLMRINTRGPFLLTQAAAKWMLSQKQTGEPPKIVFVSSVSAYTASVNRGDYCVSKAGISMLVSLFAARLAGDGINVYEIRPGIIATDMTGPVKEKYDNLIAGGLTPIKRWGKPEDVAKAVTAVALGLLPFSTGEVINVDGGFHLRTL